MAPIAIQDLKHDVIEPDPRNPRQACDEEQLTELGTDIAVRGILQPIVVRPHPDKKGHFMIVFGERRWRAAGMVDLATVPCIVRQYDSELAVLEDQIAENGKRADVHPLEEADAYRRLHEEHGRDVEEIAELTGKSKAYIYAAMKLCALTAEPRRAFLDGKFDKSVALLIARLPTSQHNDATAMLLRDGEQPSYRDAQYEIRRRFLLRLADVPWKLDDAGLVPAPGKLPLPPCTTCPKRTGNQRELFEDVVAERGGADVCTDPDCHRAKLDAHWLRVKVDAEANGRQAVEVKHLTAPKGQVRLDEHAPQANYNKTYRELLGKKADDIVATVARDERDGRIVEFASKKDLDAALTAAGVKSKAKGASPSESDYERMQREAKEKREIEIAVAREQRLAVLQALLTRPDHDETLWRMLAHLALRTVRNDGKRELMKQLNLGKGDGSMAETLHVYVDELAAAKAKQLAVLALLVEGGPWRGEADDSADLDWRPGISHAAKALDVDLSVIAARVHKETAEEAKAAKKAKPATEKKPKKAATPANGVAPAAEATS